ncbi:MAG TPA: methyltransferase domain-containing protein [Pyrinomonadaceae bacterium]|jgi:predicted SAM-dependent methyltransferase
MQGLGQFKRAILSVPALRRLHRARRVRQLRAQMQATRPLNVVLGAGTTDYKGWFGTHLETLDITSPRDWRNLFAPESIDRLLTEHVLEHLSEEECRIAVAECYRYLKRGGLLRIAVPDGYRRDAAYVAEASPPKDGHKVLFTVDTLVPLLESVGFRATPLEYFDAEEKFHAEEWDESDGFIKRSVRFDTQEDFKRGELFYTSLIVDARKI